VLVIHRHPCGFASSLDGLGWDFRIDRLLSQPKLVSEHLGEFEDTLRAARHDPWLRKGAFWGALHRVFLNQAAQHPEWLFWPYEAICTDPELQFEAIAGALGWPFHREAFRRSSPGTSASSRDRGSTRKRSGEMASIWRSRLSAAAIDAVTGIAREFVPPGRLATLSPVPGAVKDGW